MVTAEVIHVDVTAADVADGVVCDRQWCAGALAFCRARPGARDVRVGNLVVVWREGEVKFSAALPPAAQRFIAQTDRGRGAEPVAFDLTPEPLR